MGVGSIIVCFAIVFLVGCVFGMVLTCLAAESGDGKYYDVDELEILDIMTEGDDED